MNWSKLASRKLWVTIIGGIILSLAYEGGAPPEIISTIKWLLVTYLGAQGLADYGKARNGG